MFSLALLSPSWFALAAPPTLPDPCVDPSIESISIPQFPDQARSPTFKFSFFHKRRVNSTAPTIIFLPGGPGGGSIMSDISVGEGPLHEIVYNLPTYADYILTDPRGVGCNKNPQISWPDEAFSTELLAIDVIEMIKALRERNELGSFVIWGHSYGSLLATFVASKAEEEGLQPQAVVLSGVIGRAWRADENDEQGKIDEWRLFKKSLSQDVIDKLSGPTLPFDLPSEAWGYFIDSGLTNGLGYKNKVPSYPLRNSLMALSSNDPKALADLKNAVIEAGNKTYKKELIRMFRPIACQEVFPRAKLDKEKLIAGEIVTASTTVCDGFTFSNPFDSADYQIEAPIFYFQGKNDPAVPLWQATYHFDSQLYAKKFFVKVPGAAHPALQSGFFECRDQLWKSIFDGGNNLESVLPNCSAPTELSIEAQSPIIYRILAPRPSARSQWDDPGRFDFTSVAK